jgi:sphingomyelin phosphodiesterase acid-like 3
MQSRQPSAKFLTVSDDLIAHAFSCRYAALPPSATPSDYQTFVLKTLSLVMGELCATFPGLPVYVALSNNDTGCDDYRLDAESDFLAEAGRIVAEGLPPSQRQQLVKEFAEGSYYSISIGEPMHGARFIVSTTCFSRPSTGQTWATRRN